MKKIIYFAVSTLTLSISSCSKNLEQTLPTDGIVVKANTPSPSLDWSNLSSFKNGPNQIIPAPWSGGASRAFPTDYLSDYKPEDGWVMYFNTINESKEVDAPYFVLYNRYRGIMRIYYYFMPKSGVETSQVTFQLDLKGTENNSNILSFDNQETIDFGTRPTTISKVQHEKIYQSGAWYAEEFQLAYDPSLENKSYTTNQLRWNMFSTSIDQVNLDGIQKGEINGTVQTPKPTTSFLGQLVSGAINLGTGGIGTYAAGAKILGNFFSKSFGPVKLENVKKGIEDAASKNLKTGGSSIFNAMTSLVTGGNGGGFSEQKVNLIMDTEMQLTGSIKHDPNGLFSTSLFISGTQGLSQAPGDIPNYSGKLGIFNISAKPKIIAKDFTPSLEPPRDDVMQKKYAVSYTVDKESFQFITNPDIINNTLSGATIQNYQVEVVTDDLSDIAPYDFEQSPSTIEYIGSTKKVVTGSSLIFAFWTRTNPGPVKFQIGEINTYIRISFDVVPNNGKPKTTIVKTFEADLVNNFSGIYYQ
ncbi:MULTISPECIES: hypothetical protein [unclassified Sphingobacterium]|uniref:hypothetical protein n=1 Tax=unclassified Sphingobacterium TaxID=2609468 RepID=UPI002955D7EF|nr:hypothetical protein [Sphingobacterium sp. UGAL515B_05]WON95238.1 hypothetical protein OK025_02190 [Sphingobacterium sp. UGAL515B_05]